MGMRKVAVVGAGMTKFVRRAQETVKELSWEAAHMALESCEMTMDDIEAVCFGTAPDAFDGVHLNGEYASDGSGGWRKPFMRSYVGGGTGVFVPVQGWYHIASGLFDVVMVVAEEKMSSYYPHHRPFPDDIRPHNGTPVETEPTLDLCIGNEPLHDHLWYIQSGYSAGGSSA
jgi:acetyl-CoA C-acetyltransferase